MISSTARQIVASSKVLLRDPVQIRLASPSWSSSFSSASKDSQRREMHATTRRGADAATTADPLIATAKEEKTIVDRFVVTAEVTVSKIFPAGLGWQSSSIVAESYFGYAPDSMNFALTTGLGDAIGVLMGHVAFYGAKKVITGNEKILMAREIQTGTLLGSAAFCSGTVWQPAVNALQGANLSFSQVFAGTWVGCGVAFYVGLRLARTILSGPMQYVEEPTYDNGKADASLSAAIGGATGFFVGTDAAYLPDQNFLIDLVGIQDGTPDLTGCAIAGASTSLGFMTAQSGMNIIYPTGKCWND